MLIRSAAQPVPRATSTVGGTTLAAVAAVLALVMTASMAVAFQRTEVRENCASYDPLRQPFFGETHVHTGLSFDASIRFVQVTPEEAYQFTKGSSVVGVGPNGFPTRTYTQDRPLDFAAVTDHSEHFGEMGICKSPDLPGRFSLECQLLTGFYWQPGIFPGNGQRANATATFNLLTLPLKTKTSQWRHLC